METIKTEFCLIEGFWILFLGTESNLDQTTTPTYTFNFLYTNENIIQTYLSEIQLIIDIYINHT